MSITFITEGVTPGIGAQQLAPGASTVGLTPFQQSTPTFTGFEGAAIQPQNPVHPYQIVYLP